MESIINPVRTYMQSIGQETPYKPNLPDVKIRDLRNALIAEENTELYEADTAVEALDAIADLFVVLAGAAVAYGFGADICNKAFAEVMRSNNTKFWTTAEKLAYVYEGQADGILTFKTVETSGNRPWLAQRADGKQIKSPSYSPADLLPLLE